MTKAQFVIMGLLVRRDDVRCAQLSLGDELGQELAHRPRGQQVVTALGSAEARQVTANRRAYWESDAHIRVNA